MIYKSIYSLLRQNEPPAKGGGEAKSLALHDRRERKPDFASGGVEDQVLTSKKSHVTIMGAHIYIILISYKFHIYDDMQPF